LPEGELRFQDFVAAAESVMEKRAKAYNDVADHVVQTTGQTVDEIAIRIADQFTMDAAIKPPW
jgi:hypothetical protein